MIIFGSWKMWSIAVVVLVFFAMVGLWWVGAVVAGLLAITSGGYD